MKAIYCNRTKTVNVKMSQLEVWDIEDALNDENFDPLWTMVDTLKSVIPLDDTDSIVEEEQQPIPYIYFDEPVEIIPDVRTQRCQTAFIAPRCRVTFDNS